METTPEDDSPPARARKPLIGLALGSGSARGWSHIGVILELQALGVRPQIVAGTSIGALVGAVYVSGQLEAFAQWVQALTVRDVVGLMDFTFSGGMVKGEKLFSFFNEKHRNPSIEKLKQRFVTVSTEMATGREVWIARGPILHAARASCAMPGLFTPVKHRGQWMLDGGLVNPVPVSACRAHGAEVVIAVNLNAQLVGMHLSRAGQEEAVRDATSRPDPGFWHKVVGYLSSSDPLKPALFDVMAASVNIMQDRITRSRMAGDPPEITLLPVLPDFAMMDFHRAAEAIEEGRRIVRQQQVEICAWTGVERTESPASAEVPCPPASPDAGRSA